MKKILTIFLLALAVYTESLFAQSQKELRLAHIFSDDMVIQQGMSFPVWGFSEPNTEVRVAFFNAEVKAIANKEGKWLVKLPPMKAGGPYELKVNAGKILVLKNVMVGEVWLASGQSNMEFSMGKTLTSKEDIATANYPDIRFFTVPFDVSMFPQEDIKPNKWRMVTPANAAYFSAVAYHFARELHLSLKVPLGIIHSSKGGTPAEAWTSADVLAEMPEFKDKMLSLKSEANAWNTKAKTLMQLQAQRSEIVKTAAEGIKFGTNTLLYDDSHWPAKKYPLDMLSLGKQGYWGFVWFRKAIDLNKSSLSNSLKLSLPLAAQEYRVYFNDNEIGKGSDAANSFTVPKELLKEGKNILAIRILSYYGKGFLGKNNGIAAIFSADKKVNIPLDDEWKFNFDIEPKIAGAQSFAKTPSVLYNAMIAPLIPFAIKGVIWYQGEANAVNPKLYQSLFPAMIKNWRSEWGQGDFPFAYVQLAGYSRPGEEDLKWALLREAQFMSLNTPNTIMATAIDLGEKEDIHPRNKKDVGYRLALAVRSKVYAQNIIHSGPIFKDLEIHENKAIVEFRETGSGLISKDGKPLTGFEIAGKDMVFHQADAVILKNKVILSTPKVTVPRTVRYAFSSYPQMNLYNKEGLPALPFRTDK